MLRGELRRVVPRDNEEINETWISDRDRFSCHGIYSGDRLESPRIKAEDGWREVTWQEGILAAAEALKSATAGDGDALGTLVSPNATLEELYLLGRITRHLGSANIDSRLRRRDFRDQADDPVVPGLGTAIADIDGLKGALVIGSNLRMEVPILAHRIRKAARGGAKVAFVNADAYEYFFPTVSCVQTPLEDFVAGLAGVVAAAASGTNAPLPEPVKSLVAKVSPTDAQKAAAEALAEGPSVVWLGHIAQRHPRFADIRALAAALAATTGASLGYLTEGANAAGAALAGASPHRGPGGKPLSTVGRDAAGMLTSPRKAYVLFGVEPSHDVADAERATAALKDAVVIAFTSFVTPELEALADLLLPIGTFAETPGTFVNGEGRWQSFDAAAESFAESRPGWRVLRVLGNELGLPECDYRHPSDVTAALERELGGRPAPQPNDYAGAFTPSLERCELNGAVLDVPIYAVDAVVRRSAALQQTRLALEAGDRR